jgi:hypothetical protein
MTAADDTPLWRAQQTNPLAIVSMVCGMVALALGPLAILAIISGHIGRGQVRRTGEGGRGMATAGLILGYMVLVVGIALIVAFLASLPGLVSDGPNPRHLDSVEGSYSCPCCGRLTLGRSPTVRFSGATCPESGRPRGSGRAGGRTHCAGENRTRGRVFGAGRGAEPSGKEGVRRTGPRCGGSG